MRRAGGVVGLALVLTLGRASAGQEVDRPRLEAEAAGQAAEADRLYKAGKPADALTFYLAERDARRALGDLRYEAYAIRGAGLCLLALEAHAEAVAALSEALVLDLRREDEGLAGLDGLLLGRARYEGLGEVDAAIEALEAAVPRLARSGSRDDEWEARLVLGRALVDAGRSVDARPHLDRALDLAAARDDPRRLAETRLEAGDAARASGDLGAALEWFAEAADGFEALESEPEAVEASRSVADALLDLGLPGPAEARARDVEARRARLDRPDRLADDRLFLAGLRIDAGDLAGAARLAAGAVEAADGSLDADLARESRVVRADVQARSGDWTAAAATLADALALEPAPEPAERVRLLLLAAAVERRADRPDRADARLAEARTAAAEADDPALLRAVENARPRTEASPAPERPARP